MYYYFDSIVLSAIKIDGKYYGTMRKLIPYQSDKDFFVEICPLDGYGKIYGAVIDENFLSNPPPNVIVTELKGGYLINFSSFDCTFMILSQIKQNNVIATVYCENGVKISIETNYDFFIDNINYFCLRAEISCFSQNNNDFLAVILYGKSTMLLVYHLGEKISQKFFSYVDEFSFNPCLSTITNCHDIAKHKIKTDWEFKDNIFLSQNKSIETSQKFDISILPNKIIPYAFFEELNIGGNLEPYLSQQMNEKSDKLLSYTGEFVGVFPPPPFIDQNLIGLIYKKSNNLFYAEYFLVEMQDRLITNIKKT